MTTQHSIQPLWRSILGLPRTRAGRWAAGLTVGFVVLFAINSLVFIPMTTNEPWQHTLLPFYGFLMIGVGLAAGTMSAVAVVHNHERSWLAWLALLPGLFILFLLVGEVVAPH